MRITLLVAVALLACKKSQPSIEEALANIGPQVNAKLDRLHAIAPSVATVDRSSAYAGQPLQTSELDPHHPVVGNAVLIYGTDLQRIDDAEHAPDIAYRAFGSDNVIGCYYAFRKRLAFFREQRSFDPIAGGQLAVFCDDLIHADKLVVIMPGETGTAMPGDALQGGDPSKFSGGGAEGTLLVFDVGNGKYLGSRSYHAKQSESLSYRAKAGGNDTDRMIAAAHALKADLESKLTAAIRDALAGH